MTNFAAIQARANAAIFRHLATDEAELDLVPVKGKFDRPSGEVFDGMATTMPRFGLASELAASATLDSELRLLNVGGHPSSERFSVKSVDPDGSGWTVLTLQAAL